MSTLHMPQTSPAGGLTNAATIGSRIFITGRPGAGKTTLAGRLSPVLGLPVIELDSIIGWHVDKSDAELRDDMRRALDAKPQGWICEGSWGDSFEVVAPLADTIIQLDLPPYQTYTRLVKRTVAHGLNKTSLLPNPLYVLRGIYRYGGLLLLKALVTREKKISPGSSRDAPAQTVITLKTQHELEAFVQELCRTVLPS